MGTFKTILITGSAGNIGSSLINFLSSKLPNTQFISVDNYSTGNLSKIIQRENIETLKCNVNNRDEISKIFSRYQINAVFHYAACVGVERTINNPQLVFLDLDGFRNIFDLCVRHEVEKIAFSSSSEVYGEPRSLPLMENDTPLNPALPYAGVKLMGEIYCEAYHKKFGLPYHIFRLFNTYGPNQSDDFVVSKFINLALQNKDIEIFGDGTKTRTLTYIDDHISATTEAFFNNKFMNQPVNIGSDRQLTITEIANQIIVTCNSKSKIIYKDNRQIGDSMMRQPSNKIYRELLGRDEVSFNNGIRKIISDRTL